ncbi:DEAD/DEAH box helicase [uncultured Methanospirillum sp.]|uniref:DEAD/DEAH box helicase n=1 Tax=uncultured Methanospirillum sp. TaxID=262503 RepID=UPI0029C601E4|nr:DEAD/DEAH box helicase [uncultured Methanospirillum sp.]
MIILHGLYSPAAPDQFILFAEDTTISLEQSKSPRQGRKMQKSSLLSHPAALSSSELVRTLDNWGVLPSRFEEMVITLSLPTYEQGKNPVCSPEYYQQKSLETPKTTSFCTWSVPVVRFPLEYIPPVITGIRNLDDGAYIMAETLLYWSKVTAGGLSLISAGHYLPAYRMIGRSGFHVLWDLHPDESEHEMIRAFHAAIPPFCIPATGFGLHVPELHEYQTQSTVYTFLTSLVRRVIYEALVRRPVDLHLTPAVMIQQTIPLIFYLNLTGQSSLLGLDSLLPAEHGDGKRLISWMQKPTDTKVTTQMGLVLRVHEPEKEGGSWLITYELRPADDLTCLIPAAEIWSGGDILSETLPSLRILEETLLQELGRGSAVSNSILLSLSSPAPGGFALSTPDLWTFLTHDVPLLKEIGIETIIPSWWTERKSKPVIRIRVSRDPSAVTCFGLDTVVSFDYQVALGDEILTPEEFLQRTDLKNSIIRTGDGWMVCQSGDLEKNLRRLQDAYAGETLPAVDLFRLIAHADDEESFIEVIGDDSWSQDLVLTAKGGGLLQDQKIPASFSGILRPYQVSGFSFLLAGAERGFGVCLADDMGLGKTPQTIAYLLSRKEAGLSGPSLLICPTSVAGNWERELSRFSPSLTVYVHHGTGREKSGFSEMVSAHDLVITTYPLASRDSDLITAIRWNSLILDEAQNIKNPRTKQSRSIFLIQADHRVALTGTPVENRLSELWSIMQFLNPGYLGSAQQFRIGYSVPIEKDANQEKAEELRRLIRPFLLRRLKTDKNIIRDLPEKMESRIFVTLTREQVTLYQAVVNEVKQAAEKLTGIARRGMILAALTKLKQIADHPHLYTHDGVTGSFRSGKVRRLLEMLEEVSDEGDAAIIFTQFASFASLLQQAIEEHFHAPVLLLTGRTRRHTRDEMITRFMKPDGPKFFVISLKAGGTGLNLTRANHVFHVDRWWNPAVEDQATDRAFRIGQIRDVQVHLMVAAGTLEERIDDVLAGKRGLATEILSSGEDWLTSLSTKELIDVITLRDAVFEEY